MTPLEMVQKAIGQGCQDYKSVVKFVFANFKVVMRPSVAANLLTVIRKKQTPAASKVTPSLQNDGLLPVTVEFGEEVVKAVVALINKYGYDRVRGAVELSSWFYAKPELV